MSATDHLQADPCGVLIPCASCGSRNRIPFARLDQTGRCGTCRATLPLPDSPVAIDSHASFEALIATASLPVVADFWAPWCGPCRVVAPEVSLLAKRSSGQILVAKVDTESQPVIASRMQIRSIPTFALFRHGREIARQSGAMSADQLRAWIHRAIGSGEPTSRKGP